MKLAYVMKFVADMNRAGLPQYSRCPSHVPQLSISWRVGRKPPRNRQLDYDTPAIQPRLFGVVRGRSSRGMVRPSMNERRSDDERLRKIRERVSSERDRHSQRKTDLCNVRGKRTN